MILPISVREPEIGALMHGDMDVLIRPVGRLAVLKKFDLLWLREPFYIPQAFAHRAPTSAATAASCRPAFAADHSPAWFATNAAQFGKRRHARELPKAWHRTHLRILTVEQIPLHDVDNVDLAKAGWASRDAFVKRWNQDAEFDKYRASPSVRYAANPIVLRIGFRRVDGQLPGYKAVAGRVEPRAASRLATARAASSEARL